MAQKVMLNGIEVRAIGLDVDGTMTELRSSLPHKIESTAQALGLPHEHILPHFQEVYAGLKREVGNPWESARILFPTISDAEVEAFVHLFHDYEYRDPYPPVEGLNDALEFFWSRNIPISLCTANDYRTLIWKLRTMGLDPAHFLEMCTWDRKYRKPDPRALLPAIVASDIEPQHFLSIGDSLTDYLTAQKIEMYATSVQFIAVIAHGLTPSHRFHELGVETVWSLPDVIKLFELA